MRRLWLHIGAPKTGTTALQRAFNELSAKLADHGLTYIAPHRRTSSNALAIALINQRKDDIEGLGRNMQRKARRAPGDVIISSEQFFGLAPGLIAQGFPLFAEFEICVLCYIRRQDIYLESKYIQKRKRGVFQGSLFDFIEAFDGSGADYETALTPWEAIGARVHLRIAETDRLSGGSVVSDALNVLGVPNLAGFLSEDREVNSSPSFKRLQLLEAAKAAGFRDIKRLQRLLPPDTGEKARFLTPDERMRVMAGYAEMNERLRRRFFPDQDSLFSEQGMEHDIRDQPMYSREDLDRITEVMRTMLEMVD